MGQDFGCDYMYFQRVRGDICNGENIFDEDNSFFLAELEKIKAEARKLAASDFPIAFWNL